MKEAFMEEAIALAKQGIGHTSPNPCVGAVLVKGNTIIGRGYHTKAGMPHAEVNAVQDAKKHGHNPKNATLYVTLEPCRHIGKTPACTDLIVEHGITRVCIGMRDPHKHVNGQGMHILKQQGVATEVLSKSSPVYRELRLLNQPFFKWATTHLPYVTLKAAVSLDGRIATHGGESKWITGRDARTNGRIERSICDAVLVGAGTVAADNPTLAAHGLYKNKPLLRIIIDPTLRLDPDLRVFRDAHVLVATTKAAPKKRQQLYNTRGIPYKAFGPTRVSIKRLLQHLGQRDIQHLYIEGGSGTHGSFLDEHLFDPLVIDRVLWYIAPKIIGGEQALGSIGGVGAKTMSDALTLEHMTVTHIGKDLKIEGIVHEY